jgi:hypothetical protein
MEEGKLNRGEGLDFIKSRDRQGEKSSGIHFLFFLFFLFSHFHHSISIQSIQLPCPSDLFLNPNHSPQVPEPKAPMVAHWAKSI